MKWYSVSYARSLSGGGFNVTYHLMTDFVSRWTAIHGVQIGDWFIGAIKGHRIEKVPSIGFSPSLSDDDDGDDLWVSSSPSPSPEWNGED